MKHSSTAASESRQHVNQITVACSVVADMSRRSSNRLSLLKNDDQQDFMGGNAAVSQDIPHRNQDPRDGKIIVLTKLWPTNILSTINQR